MATRSATDLPQPHAPRLSQVVDHDPLYSTASVGEAQSVGSGLLGQHRLHAAGQERFHARFNAIELADLSIVLLSFSDRIHATSMQPLQGYVAFLPLAGRVAVSTPSHPTILLRPGAGCVLNPDEVLQKTTLDPHTTELIVRIPATTMERHLSGLVPAVRGDPVSFEPVTEAEAPWSAALSLAVGAMDKSTGANLAPKVADALEAHIVQALLLSHPHSRSIALFSSRGETRRDTILQVARELENHVAGEVCVATLARDHGLSVRELRAGFREVMGVSPTAFIRNSRLDEAHRRLTGTAAGRVTVADVAHGLGFSHLGRFAASYRQRFGILPSVTLARSRPRTHG